MGKDAEHSSSEEERSAGFRVAAYGRAFHEAQSDFSVCSVAISVVLHGAAQHASVTTLPCEKQSNWHQVALALGTEATEAARDYRAKHP